MLSLEEDVSNNTANYPTNYFADISTTQESIDGAKWYTQGTYMAIQHEHAFGLVKSKLKKPDPHLVNPQSNFIPFHDVFRRIVNSLGDDYECTQAYSHVRAGSVEADKAGNLDFHTDEEQDAVDFRVVVHQAPHSTATTIRDGVESADITYRPGIDANIINSSLLARRRHAVLPQDANNLSNVFSFRYKDKAPMTNERFQNIKARIAALPASPTPTPTSPFAIRLPKSCGKSTMSIVNSIRGIASGAVASKAAATKPEDRTLKQQKIIGDRSDAGIASGTVASEAAATKPEDRTLKQQKIIGDRSDAGAKTITGEFASDLDSKYKVTCSGKPSFCTMGREHTFESKCLSQKRSKKFYWPCKRTTSKKYADHLAAASHANGNFHKI